MNKRPTATGIEQPSCCEGCTDDAAPLYLFQISVESKGWQTVRRALWLCATCHHKLAFEGSIFHAEE
jgi:hypothetical protein